MSSEDDSNCNEYQQQQSNNNKPQKVTGRKRAIVRKYGKAIAISTTLLYGPMACLPSTRRITSTTAHAAASTTATATTDSYNFKDFKDMKGKLSLAPGANVQVYEEVLAKVEVEGEEALKDSKYGEKTTLSIGESGEDEGDG